MAKPRHVPRHQHHKRAQSGRIAFPSLPAFPGPEAGPCHPGQSSHTHSTTTPDFIKDSSRTPSGQLGRVPTVGFEVIWLSPEDGHTFFKWLAGCEADLSLPVSGCLHPPRTALSHTSRLQPWRHSLGLVSPLGSCGVFQKQGQLLTTAAQSGS